MYNRYFLDSFNKYLSTKYVLLAKKIPQVCPTGYFQSKGFDLAMLEKIKWIIANIDIADPTPLVYADCDVQFFGDLEFDLGEKDIVFQHDYHAGYCCAGFFICKQNLQVLNFFKQVEQNFKHTMNGIRHDQDVMNDMFKSGYSGVKRGMLPDNKYWTVANGISGNIWVGQDFFVPYEILMHHANFTVGLENKLKLLELVKEKVNK
jgi:hypothetical protein